MPNSLSPHVSSIPSQAWMPCRDASICVFWDCIRSGTFSIALQVLDRSLIPAGDNGIILQTTISSAARVQVPFSLRDERSSVTVVSGRFVLRADDRGILQLWLVDARYPGGATPEAQISGRTP